MLRGSYLPAGAGKVKDEQRLIFLSLLGDILPVYQYVSALGRTNASNAALVGTESPDPTLVLELRKRGWSPKPALTRSGG